MGIATVFMISFVLGLDAFSLSIGIGLCGIRRNIAYFFSSIIAVFHIIMPLLGLYLGKVLGEFIGPVADKIGALILILIGIHYLYENFTADPRNCADFDCSTLNKPLGLFLLACSVSLDAFVVGVGLGTMGVNLVFTVLIMGFMAGFMTLTGLFLGGKVNGLLGKRAEFFGGIVLILLGVYFFFW